MTVYLVLHKTRSPKATFNCVHKKWSDVIRHLDSLDEGDRRIFPETGPAELLQIREADWLLPRALSACTDCGGAQTLSLLQHKMSIAHVQVVGTTEQRSHRNCHQQTAWAMFWHLLQRQFSLSCLLRLRRNWVGWQTVSLEQTAQSKRWLQNK